MTNGTHKITLGDLGFEFFIRSRTKRRQVSGLFSRIPVIKIKPVSVFFMALESMWTQKTFAGTGTDLAIHLGFLQTFGSPTIMNLSHFTQTVNAVSRRLVKLTVTAFVPVASRALTNAVLTRHTYLLVLPLKLFLAHRLGRSRRSAVHHGLDLATKQLLTHECGSLFVGELTAFNATFQLQHLKEGGIQLVIGVLVEDTREVCLQLGILCLQVSQLLLVALLLEVTPPLLTVIHLTDHCLNLRG